MPAKTTDLQQLRHILEKSECFESIRTDYQIRLRQSSQELLVEELPVLVKAVHKNGIAVDFSLLYEEDGICWHGSMMHRWEHSPLNLIEYQLRGVKILGPGDGDCYLTEGYGDWRTPVKEFNCSSGRHNLVVVKNLLGVCLFLKRLIWHLSQRDSKGYVAVLKQMKLQRLIVPSEQGATFTMNRKWFEE